jgi:hypothetical protein
VFALFNDSKEVSDSDVFEFLLSKQFSKDKLQVAFSDRVQQRLIEPILKATELCASINNAEYSKILQEGKALAIALEGKLLPHIYKKLRNRI